MAMLPAMYGAPAGADGIEEVTATCTAARW
jgi:hypothetical protein